MIATSIPFLQYELHMRYTPSVGIADQSLWESVQYEPYRKKECINSDKRLCVAWFANYSK